MTNQKQGIGTLGEYDLHAALKRYCMQPGDKLEVPLEGYVIDIVRDIPDAGKLLIEIQTGNFAALKKKLAALLHADYSIRLVHPIAQMRWIVREEVSGKRISRRKSPRRGTVLDVFRELVRIPHPVKHPNFSLEVLLIHEEQILTNDGKGSWRRKGWSVTNRRLVEVMEHYLFCTPEDFLKLLPESLPEPFTTADVASGLHSPRPLAQKMMYTLHKMGGLEKVGKKGNAWLYRCVISR